MERVLITHGHLDHVGGLDDFVKMTGGAPVAAGSDRWSHGAAPVRDGDRLELAGLSITVLATPGHTADSLCFLVDGPDGDPGRADRGHDPRPRHHRGRVARRRPRRISGQPRRLSGLVSVPVLPGHGPVLADCGAIATAYRAHREDRLAQVRSALAGGATTPAEVVAVVYPDLDPVLVPAAEWTVRAALAYLDPDHVGLS